MIARALQAASLAGLVLAGALPAHAASLDEVKRRGELRVAADPTAGAPYYVKAAEGYTGFEAELACAIAKRLGVKITFVTAPWSRLIDTLRDGQADLVLNAHEIGAKPGVSFTKPYYVASQALVVPQKETRIYGVKDLAGRKVGTTAGSVAATVLAHLPKPAVVKPYADTEGPFKALGAGQVDAVLLESAMVRWHAKQSGAKLRVVGLPMLPRPYGGAVKTEDVTLLTAVDGAIAAMRRDGELKRTLDQYGLWDGVQSGTPAPAPSASPAAAPAPHHRRRHRHH